MLPVLVPCREEKGMGELDKVHDAVCNYCGCLCDDLEVTIEDNKITKVSKACTIGKNRLLSPVEPARCRVDGQEASLDDALAAAAKILSKAKNPLIYGLSSTTCEAQKKAVEIAEITGASLDSTSSVCHGPGSMARQMEGLPTCALGINNLRSLKRPLYDAAILYINRLSFTIYSMNGVINSTIDYLVHGKILSLSISSTCSSGR
jgi:hypothetical protein